jgi:PEP-CTERM motif
MRLRLLLPATLAAIALLSASLAAHANSIVFEGQSGNTYYYGVDATSRVLTFTPGETLTFTGLADVTGASYIYPDLFIATFTSTSVTFTNPGSVGFESGVYPDFFTIDSTAPLGTVMYTADTTSGIISGSIGGPASVTPEPSTFALFGTGLIGLAGAARRKFIR